jgi:hypothetical protein
MATARYSIRCGVCEPEGPFAALGMPLFRWLEGESTAFVVSPVSSGFHLVILEYQNILFDRQSVEILLNHQTIAKKQLRRTQPNQVRLVSFGADLEGPECELELKFEHHLRSEDDPRRLALAMISLTIFDVSNALKDRDV